MPEVSSYKYLRCKGVTKSKFHETGFVRNEAKKFDRNYNKMKVNDAVELLTLLLQIVEVLGLNLGPELGFARFWSFRLTNAGAVPKIRQQKLNATSFPTHYSLITLIASLRKTLF
jgi:hypothetical protein